MNSILYIVEFNVMTFDLVSYLILNNICYEL